MKTVLAIGIILMSSQGWAQASQTTPAASAGWFDINIILVILAVFLLFPLQALAKAFEASAKQKLQSKVKSDAQKIGILIALVLSTQAGNAQTAVTTPMASNGGFAHTLTITLLCLIGLEILLMFFFAIRIADLAKPDTQAVRAAEAGQGILDRLRNLWTKLNFKPIEQEAQMDLGHDYDGIRELDNVIPPWFTTAFILTILFAGVYLYRYHIAKSAPMQLEEYKIAVARAELEHETYLATQSNAIDENSVSSMTTFDVEAGKQIFNTSCAVCHRPDGGGQVGPNLTDEYWIHGGGMKNIFTTIKYGVPDKGMISWKEQLSPSQMAEVSHYIMTLQGTNPPAPKEKQGTLYVPETIATDTIAKTPDTLQVK